jgi:Kef-type K+ transport system membrane component KefB
MRSRRQLLSTLAYAAMILAALAIFLIVREYGETLAAPAPQTPAAVSPEQPDSPQANALSHILLALAAVVVVGRLLGRAFARIGQPPVIGEVLGGILLGPSLLGRVAPDVAAYVLPVAVAPYLSVVAQLGVILYMFLVGLDLNLDPLRSRARAAVATSHASILAPFVLGSLLALYLYPRVSTNDVPFTSFALFMGVAMSITAFPVLARILSDRGMTRSELGVIALACAAADDVTAWCLLAFVVGVVQSEVGSALLVAVYTLAFIAVMFFAVKPLVARLVHRRGNGSAARPDAPVRADDGADWRARGVWRVPVRRDCPA